MPDRYKLLYREEEVRNHAAIAWRRGAAAIHLEQLPGQDAAWWLCVITDDRPALLSMLSAAITAHSLDILSARIYCRARSSQDGEAVDFFCIRRLKPPPLGRLDDSELASLKKTMASLLRGEADVPSLAKHSSPTTRMRAPPLANVHFEEGHWGTDLLVVDANDQPGLLLSITLALSKEKVTIAWSDVMTVSGRARDEFHLLELDGSRLSDSRKAALLERVSKAVAELR